MDGLSLCAGIGGLDLGLRAAVPRYRTVGYVEIDRFCQEVLLARMADGSLDAAPIWDDLATFDGLEWRGVVDCVLAGFPCQPFSVAGKRHGSRDERHLWPDIARVIGEVRPPVVFLENVPGLLTTLAPDGTPAFVSVADDLSGLGYRVAAGLFTAAEVGAPHRRQRLYVLAHAGCAEWRTHAAALDDGGEGPDGGRAEDAHWLGKRGGVVGDAVRARRATTGIGRDLDAGAEPEAGGGGGVVGEPDLAGFQRREQSLICGGDERPPWPPGPAERDRWERILRLHPELAPAVDDSVRRRHRPAVGQVRAGGNGTVLPSEDWQPEAAQPALRRVADGPARRVDRLRALGNAVVPAVAARAYRVLTEELAHA